MHLLRLPHPQEDKTAGSETGSRQIVLTALVSAANDQDGWATKFLF